MIIRSKAPLRLGLAGGGTDVAPYSDRYGGAVLNATISLYAYATIIPRSDDNIYLISENQEIKQQHVAGGLLPIDGILDLQKGVYNYVVRTMAEVIRTGFELYTYVDAPPGSGLGTSSTLTVAVLGAFAEWLKLPMGEYDLAQTAYEIEREDLAMAGGKQDQYAATFGGVNFMEFGKGKDVIVNPLRIRNDYLSELSHNLVLYYTETSRLSSQIIASQAQNVINNQQSSIEAMHHLKKQAGMMKEAVLKGELNEIGSILNFGWQFKKQMTSDITNTAIDRLYDAAMAAGATGGKISGAGGGGFMLFYCPAMNRTAVIKALKSYGGYATRYEFVNQGVITWTINNG